ncbi:hypothetical protein HPB50_023182 [Hyalomma asiaticum]|uniref:Uncharacterized protein n=1 Tax=Hyalomma asiaticum TaxID=266040 RepID=A0ACB7TMC3_HYAAI|nr:hypothetical protein HPB50_023182 [Hyalomma asiaticum]
MLSGLLKTSYQKDQIAPTENLKVLGGIPVPRDITTPLNKGPKYGIEPDVPAHDLLALNRRIARKAPVGQREPFLLDGVDRCLRLMSQLDGKRACCVGL